MDPDDLEAPDGEPSIGRRVVLATQWCGLITSVLTLVYVADVVSGGRVGATVDPYLRRAKVRGRELVANLNREHELVLAGRRLVWDACETVMDADPEWWARVRPAAA